jgi:mannose-6-phosphate isomerase
MRYYPMKLAPQLHTRVWGGRLLQTRLAKPLPTSQPYGESWEIFWQNTISNGTLAGQSLGEAISKHPLALTGQARADSEYPLLVKFLDAQDWLSVQVHPDDAWAARLEGQPRGKTECWYVVEAAPQAKIAYGLSQELDSERYRQAVQAGRTREMLQFVEVAAGDMIFVPAGTQHAIGPGLLIYELQQTSDTTYRVYDWDRVGLDGQPRPLHLESALQVTHYSVNPQAKTRYATRLVNSATLHATLVSSDYFTLEKIMLEDSSYTTHQNDESPPFLLTCIAGKCQIEAANDTFITLHKGESAFMPTALGGFTLHGTAEILQAYESNLKREV